MRNIFDWEEEKIPWQKIRIQKWNKAERKNCKKILAESREREKIKDSQKKLVAERKSKKPKRGKSIKRKVKPMYSEESVA